VNADRIEYVALLKSTPALDLGQWTFGEPGQNEREEIKMSSNDIPEIRTREEMEEVIRYAKEENLGHTPAQWRKAVFGWKKKSLKAKLKNTEDKETRQVIKRYLKCLNAFETAAQIYG
jgi:hypothetical protein